MLRTIAMLLSLGVLSACVAAATAAGPNAGTAEPVLTAEPAAATPGEALVLRGRGFPRDARIALLAGPPGGEAQRIGGAQTGRRGAFTATIRIRANADPGRLVARACVDGCRVKASTTFRIVAP